MEGRIPPHSDDAERSVVGAALQSEKALNAVVEILRKDDFYREYHGVIFETLKEMDEAGTHVDVLTLAEAIKKKKLLSQVGGDAYLGNLSGAAPSPAGAAQYARIVKEKAILRRLIQSAQLIEAEGYDDKEPAQAILERAEDSIFQISQGTQQRDYSPLRDVVAENVTQMTEHHKSGRKLLGLSTGFSDLDKITSGLQKQDLIILAARPSQGKTALALNIALNAATKENAHILFFSLEMGELPLGQRMLSIVAGVDLAKIRDGSLFNSTSDTKKFNEAVEKLGAMHIFIDETSGISVSEMKSKCKRLIVSEGRLDLVIIDYLQLMEMAGKSENRTLEIAAISRSLKQMAKEVDCPVIVLSQLSRDSEKRPGKPVLSDLRDSGAIEQDGDLIMFIHNKSEKEVKAEEMNPDIEIPYNRDTMRQVLVLKHRNGETGDVTLSWLGRYTKFANLSRDQGRSSYGDLPEEAEGFDEPLPF
ncbi:MAG: replicative DNA helicase [Clostridiales Family XIII bacterium]|jgi:replicative DNA helicase|nr:replicative DNA helicase [Clostridiales Family XIII bacterium]